MPILFEPADFLGIKLKNRFVRSATAENMAGADGGVTDALLSLYTSLADGQIGLIITSAAFPKRDWFPAPVPLLLYIDDDGFIPGLKTLVDTAHSRGSAIMMQMVPPAVVGSKAVGPSTLSEEVGLPAVREMTVGEIESSVETFGEAGRRAREAGFDGVQLHICHGDTFSRFISPMFNRRDDRYGGSHENRARFIVESVQAIKSAAGEDYPVLVKMNISDFCTGGMTIDDSEAIAEIICNNGVSAVEPSGGGPGSSYTAGGPVDKKLWHEGYFVDYAARIKQATGAPVIIVGGFRSFDQVEKVIADGKGDLIAMSRPFIREPGLIKRWMAGDTRPSDCTSCSGCLARYRNYDPILCVLLQSTHQDL